MGKGCLQRRYFTVLSCRSIVMLRRKVRVNADNASIACVRTIVRHMKWYKCCTVQASQEFVDDDDDHDVHNNELIFILFLTGVIILIITKIILRRDMSSNQ